jgi:4-hydroxy-tetrahydrodipicolinate reductase
MDIALIGTGRMGSAVAEAAADRGWFARWQFDALRPFAPGGYLDISGDADAVIDFSSAQQTLLHIECCCELGLPLVVGTTGWTAQIAEARNLVEERNGTVLFAPNFSLGVAMLTRAIRAVTPLLDRLPDYDVSIHEVHHTGKADSPSGTALRLAEEICESVDRKTTVHAGPQPAPVDPHRLQVTAARIGHEFGHHTVWLDGPADRILFSHEARSRRGFAEGALAAAQWLQGKRGFYTLDDMLDDWLTPASSTSTFF